MDNQYNIFGSADSLDYDVMVYVDEIPCKQDCKALCTHFEKELEKELPGKPINVNLAVAKGGIIMDVFKGTPDECNNSILKTHEYHDQNYPCVVWLKVDRDVPLKLARAIRGILSFLSRTEYRKEIKAALKGTIEDKLTVLAKIDFAKITDINKNNQDIIEFRKQAAFQMAQCLSLMMVDPRVELYTKEHAGNAYPDLRKYLNREPSDGKVLDMYKRRMIYMIRQIYKDDLEVIKE